MDERKKIHSNSMNASEGSIGGERQDEPEDGHDDVGLIAGYYAEGLERYSP